MNQRDLQSKLEQEERRVSFCLDCGFISKDNPTTILPSSSLYIYIYIYIYIFYICQIFLVWHLILIWQRIADTVDVQIKRWAAGKEGNMRALLSSLQNVRFLTIILL